MCLQRSIAFAPHRGGPPLNFYSQSELPNFLVVMLDSENKNEKMNIKCLNIESWEVLMKVLGYFGVLYFDTG